MGTEEKTNEFKRPFPALTSAQRYYLDVNGYVIVDRDQNQ